MRMTLSRQLASVGPEWLDSSLSEEGRTVQRAFIKSVDATNSITVERRREDVVQRLLDAAAEASTENWDGYGAHPADPRACSYALEVLSHLPILLPTPEVVIDSDGEVALDWDYGPRLTFSVRVGRDGTMNYAGLDGHSNFHGVEVYRGPLPRAIKHGIERVVRTR